MSSKNSRRRPSSPATLGLSCLLAGALIVDCGGSGGSSSPVGPQGPLDIRGSGNVVQQSREVTGFSRVELAGTGSLSIHMGASESLLVTAEDNLLPYLETEVRGETLEIRTESGVNLQPTEPIEYLLTATRLRRAELSGAGSIECAGLAARRLELAVSGAGELRFTKLETRELQIALDGVGHVTTSGSTERQRVTLTAVGEYRAKRLKSAIAEVEILGVGSATVRVSDRLSARVSGSGCVYYIGNPVVESTVTGPGCVEQIDG